MSGADLFQIGEVAKLFRVSAGTLRHYEQAGLLKPEYTDPETGYRYYSYRQFEALNTIRYLRNLDMSLGEIADFLKNRDTDVIEEKLLLQKETIAQKRRELELIERKIDNRIRQLQRARTAVLEEISVEACPACRIALMRGTLRPQGYLDLEQPIRQLVDGQKEPLAFLGKVGLGIAAESLSAGRYDRYDMVFLLLDEEDAYTGSTETCPAGSCVSVRFRGSHAEAPEYYERLMAYIKERELSLAGFSREITLIDYGITNDPSKFVTEIQIPVSKTE